MLKTYLRLMRIPNTLTAAADVLAGAAIAGTFMVATLGFTRPVSLGELIWTQFSPADLYPLLMLVLSGMLLYAGGVVMNDVFDAALDQRERPERPIPARQIGRNAAAVFGVLLLCAGVAAAILKTPRQPFGPSFLIALAIALAALVYNKWAKHNALLGPLNMGLCRGLNLLLGISLQAYVVSFQWKLGFLPLAYIAAVTFVSRGEVRGGSRGALYFASFLYVAVLLVLLKIAQLNGSLGLSFPFVLLAALFIFYPLNRAIRTPEPGRIRQAVKHGVLGIVLIDATWAAVYQDRPMALMILALLPLSYLLARFFAVT